MQELLDRRPGLAGYSRASYVRELHGDDDGAVVAMREAAVAGGGSTYERARVGTFLGDLALKRGDLATADAEYTLALERRPGLVFAEFGRARVLAANGRYEEAIELLERVTKRSQLPAAIILLGDLQLLVGRAGDAERSYDLVREAYRDAEEAGEVTDLEVAVFEADHARDPATAALAVERARLAYDARPDSIHVADAMAWTLAAGRRSRRGATVRRSRPASGTSDPLLHYHAAVVLEANGELGAAQAELGRAFGQNPYFTHLQRAEVTALAARLGVPTPAEWNRGSEASVQGRAALAGPVDAPDTRCVRPELFEQLRVSPTQLLGQSKSTAGAFIWPASSYPLVDETVQGRRATASRSIRPSPTGGGVPPHAPPRPARRPRVRGAASPPFSVHPNVSGTAKNA